jgi:hypothetical protein
MIKKSLAILLERDFFICIKFLTSQLYQPKNLLIQWKLRHPSIDIFSNIGKHGFVFVVH